ncbi:GDSL-type esterase/lipase family protein [Algoriphagus litoralis]|uniref:GDSL-type esterase/lipase family protein n=1 Tax=Algoriphagus litoralis TaxID=2202829 RepID=UPI000DBA3E34|nr:GDSL-type esterase/lipase family protein [Algoriphagus litoralis]
MVAEYHLFKAKLYPVLPFLIFQAFRIRQIRPQLPALSENLTLGNGNRKLLILGESTAAGVGASAQRFTLAGQFFQHLGSEFQVKNLGKNGLQVHQVTSHFNKELNAIQDRFEGIMLFLGANDCFKLTAPDKFRIELDKLISDLKNRFSPDWIYLADIPPVHLFPAFPKLMQYFLQGQRNFLQKEMISISQSQKEVLFDKITLDINSDFFASDLIHPADEGYQKIAKFTLDGLSTRGLLKLA